MQRSKRKQQVPFAKEFLQDPSGNPPLARLVQGGRGGEVRLKIYLTITLLATRAPHAIPSRSPASWVRLLGVDGQAPGRRVSTALRWLAEHKYIALTRRIGNYPQITLLDSTLTGEQYVRPLAKGSHYISLPLGLWHQGWILDLSATELALLMVLIDVQKASDQPRYVTGQDRLAYGLSPDTWTRATKKLQARGLLQVRQVSQGDEYDLQRTRNLYKVNVDRLAEPPELDRDALAP